MGKKLLPVLLGADLNCYGMACAFYRAFHVRSVVIGQEALGATAASRFLRFIARPGLGDPLVCLRVLLDFARETPDCVRLLLPGTDEYARFLIAHQAALSSAYVLPVPGENALPYFEKHHFYALCEQTGVPYPPTRLLSGTPDREEICALGTEYGYPYVLKAVCSPDYFRHPFPGMQKVFFVHNPTEAADIFASVAAAGYRGGMLAQRCIGQGDGDGYVLTVYCDRRGRVAARACGRVLLEEHTPCGRGNYAALITAPIPPVAARIGTLLSAIGYRGFANFDLRRDRDGRFYVLEMNLRPGRSNHFLTAGGLNPARLVTEDCVLGRDLVPADMTAPLLWRTVPYQTVLRYTRDPALREAAAALHRAGHEAGPWWEEDDLAFNPRRAAYVFLHMRREKEKFRRYAPL